MGDSKAIVEPLQCRCRAVAEPLQSHIKRVSMTPFRCIHGWQLVLKNPSIRELIKAILTQVFIE